MRLGIMMKNGIGVTHCVVLVKNIGATAVMVKTL